MNRIINVFDKAYRVSKERNFNRIFVGVDIHETILKPTWSRTLSTEYYENAKEALQLLSEREEICLILWSCSLVEDNQAYYEFFKKDGINFDYINSNPECPSTHFANFDLKLYFSIGLDDKFGFIPEEDWLAIKEYYETKEK